MHGDVKLADRLRPVKEGGDGEVHGVAPETNPAKKQGAAGSAAAGPEPDPRDDAAVTGSGLCEQSASGELDQER